MLVKINTRNLLTPLIAIGILCTVLTFLVPTHAMADTLTGDRLACTDGTDALNISKPDKSHGVTVTCKSGAQIDYLLSNGPYPKVITLTATCPGSEKPGPTVANPNELNNSEVYYCYNHQGGVDGGTSTKASDAPTIKQGTSTALCSDNATTVTDPSKCPSSSVSLGDATGKYDCGDSPHISVAINIGCKGKGNPVLDLTFAIIRFLSIGVGLVITGSMVLAGIQYTSSRGDPNATAKAIGRIRSNVIALLIFIFAYAILNYVVPGQVLK